MISPSACYFHCVSFISTWAGGAKPAAAEDTDPKRRLPYKLVDDTVGDMRGNGTAIVNVWKWPQQLGLMRSSPCSRSSCILPLTAWLPGSHYSMTT